jgi:hypothetical protein
MNKNKDLKTFKDSKGRKYKIQYVHSFDGIAILSQQSNGKYKQLDANKGKGKRLLDRYASDVL